MNQSKEEFLEKAKEVALRGLPFALFSYPNSADIHLIYQNDNITSLLPYSQLKSLYLVRILFPPKVIGHSIIPFLKKP